ncbi:MAG: tetratricopeptide repeat protein [Armatimonadota bacterium]|nr:tetratricopeptide repeat protein [Armatimonadota bacterium]
MKKPFAKRKAHAISCSIQSKLSYCGIAALVIATILAYIPSINNGFVWDDNTYVIHGRIMNSPNALYRYWFTSDSVDYYPLSYTLFWLEYRTWGNNAVPYHIISIILHALASVAAWMVLKRLKILGAFAAALIFAVHPVNVESVAWMFQQRTILPMVFSLAAILAYMRFEDNPKTFWYALSLLLFLLALLSKTSVVTLPFVILCLTWWRKGSIKKYDIIRAVPFFVAAVVLGFVTAWVQANRTIAGEVIRPEGLASRIAGAGWAVWFYFSKALFPYRLSFVYPRWEIDPHSIISYIPSFMVVVCLVVFWIYRKGWGRSPLVGFGCYVVTLLPVLGFLDIYFMKYSLVADHWQYQSILCVIALVIGGIVRLTRIRKGYATALVAVVTVVFITLSWRQESIYKNEIALWQDTISKNSTAWMAHVNLGLAFAERGMVDRGIAELNRALEIDPSCVEALISLGAIYNEKKEFDQAANYLKRALKLKPNNPQAHYNLGVALAGKGDIRGALALYRKAIKLDPGFAKAYANLGIVLVELGRLDEARKYFVTAIRLDPNSPQMHNNIGVALARCGLLEEAVVHFREALRLKPDYESAQRNLTYALTAIGQSY